MVEPGRPRSAPTDPIGGGGSWGPSPWFLAIALGLVAGGLAYWWMSATSPPSGADDNASPAAAPVTASSPTPGAPLRVAVAVAVAQSGPAPAIPVHAATTASGAAPAAPQRIVRTRDPHGDLTPDLSDYINDGEKPTMTEVIDRLHRAGVHTGLGAFSPPGTRPPLVGLAVPEDFVLPEGYVRHYQATDDGQRIEPILMFSPDYQFFDAANRPIAIPQDRVVPPELAPPGLPIRRIAIPAPAEPAGPGG